MAISIGRARRHIKDWTARLAPFPTRAKWPLHVFHTCQVEVAVEIIKAGQIKCRDQVDNLICDVANQGALWNNPNAHNYVRLYFRPKNGFHLKTEGVKSTTDPYRVDPHMSVPIAFAFDFEKVLTRADTGFVAGNFAKGGAAPATGDGDFESLNFDLIYHDAPPPREKMEEIHNWRMSEVVAKNALPLTDLSYVICRTPHEERTLRYLLGTHNCPSIIVEQKGSVFMRRGIFVDEIYWSSDLLRMRFHAPTVYPKDKYTVTITCWDGGNPKTQSWELAPSLYNFPSLRASKDAIWKIEIEGCMVYHDRVPSLSGLVA
ncbi:MAG: DUF4433 domain-containing protein [Rhodopseudomonas sp.]|nr:DUF4433 domain-containing protein [Rhodopseudomonas sp.]